MRKYILLAGILVAVVAMCVAFTVFGEGVQKPMAKRIIVVKLTSSCEK
jgi:hypothetical protein